MAITSTRKQALDHVVLVLFENRPAPTNVTPAQAEQ